VESGGDGAVEVGGHTPAPPDDADAPSELLAPLLEEWRDVLVKHVLERLDPTDCALLAQVGKPWLAVVVGNNRPRAGKGWSVPLKLADFVGSVERLAWAKDNGCPWDKETCEVIAAGGHLDVLQWARAHSCPWGTGTLIRAAEGGHLETLRWAREHDCPWNFRVCVYAAGGGHRDVLQWLREIGYPLDTETTAFAARCGRLEVLQWARELGWGLHSFTFQLNLSRV
jgi:hypothetical protein